MTERVNPYFARSPLQKVPFRIEFKARKEYQRPNITKFFRNPYYHRRFIMVLQYASTYRAIFAIAKHTAAKTSVSLEVSKPTISSRPPTKLRTISPALLAFLIQGLNAQAALAFILIFR